MTERHGLCDLQVRKAGHNGVRIALSLINKPRSQSGHLTSYALDGGTQVESYVSGNLIVSGAPCMQALAGIANQLGESRLDIHVHVLQLYLPMEGARGYLIFYLCQPTVDIADILIAQNTRGSQHVSMRARALNIIVSKRVIKGVGPSEFLNEHIGGFAKTTTPCLTGMTV
jgi:hypothetical protein